MYKFYICICKELWSIWHNEGALITNLESNGSLWTHASSAAGAVLRRERDMLGNEKSNSILVQITVTGVHPVSPRNQHQFLPLSLHCLWTIHDTSKPALPLFLGNSGVHEDPLAVSASSSITHDGGVVLFVPFYNTGWEDLVAKGL